MAERDDVRSDPERSSDKIRQDIAAKRETISETVDRIEERIQEKLDWKGYVAEYPYWAIGAAAGLGFMAAAMLRRRSSPIDRITDAVADTADDIGGHLLSAVGGVLARAGGRGLVKGTLYGIATKMAVDWLKGAASNPLSGDDYKKQAPPPHSESGTRARNPEPSPIQADIEPGTR